MWISKEESGIVTSSLRPKMAKTRKEHESLLDEAITLQVLTHPKFMTKNNHKTEVLLMVALFLLPEAFFCRK